MNNNWVSVEDRLPDRQDEYLILWTPKNSKFDNKFNLMYEIAEYEDGDWISEISQAIPFGGYDVHYWMELPLRPII